MKSFVVLSAITALLSLTNIQCKPNKNNFIIENKHRVANIHPGYCAWCSIEMIGRQRGIRRLVDLSKTRASDDDLVIIYKGHWKFPKNVGTEIAIQIKLNELGVKWQMQWTGNYDKRLIQYGIDNKLGCVVAVYPGALVPECHAVVLTKYNSETVEIVDPNNIGITITATRSWFDQNWNGFVVVIDRQ